MIDDSPPVFVHIIWLAQNLRFLLGSAYVSSASSTRASLRAAGRLIPFGTARLRRALAIVAYVKAYTYYPGIMSN